MTSASEFALAKAPTPARLALAGPRMVDSQVIMSIRPGVSLALFVAVACSRVPPASTPEQEDSSLPEEIGDAHLHGVVPSASLTHGLHQQLAPNTAGLLKQQGPRLSSYDASAPATVLVTTPVGHGSGVIVDPRGLVITNYHVVVAGETAELAIEADVTLVDLAPDGSARPGKTYQARALKIDAKRDLALLQLRDAPGDLPSAPLAEQDPRPGSRVIAIGHAGVGFGWAVKNCSISAIGTLDSHVAMVHLRAQQRSEQERQEIERVVASAVRDAGRQIQTDCAILPGDSGGPLIDEKSHELVGLNLAIRTATADQKSLGSLAFHIHVAELRAFLKDVPNEPDPFVPDPWEISGYEAALDDTDGNGAYDTFRLNGPCGPGFTCHAQFIDLEQRSFPKGSKTPSIADIHAQRLFRSDLVLFARARLPRAAKDDVLPTVDQFFFYDKNGDGQLDRLLVIDSEQNTSRAFVRKGSTYHRDRTRDGTNISPRLFDDARRRERFVAHGLALDTGHRDAEGARRTAAVELRVRDLSGDDIVETVLAETRTDERVLVDLGQNFLTDASGAELESLVAAGRLKFGFMAVSNAPVRVWYDTNNDGHLDVLLEAASWESQYAAVASRHAVDGKVTPAPEYVGRSLLRPALVGSAPLAERLEKVLSRVNLAPSAALDDGLSTFPEPLPSVGARISEVEESEGGAVAAVDFDRIFILLDLDGDTARREGASPDVAEAVRARRFDAEFVYVYDGTLGWAFYDSNGDGRYDLVYVARRDDPMRAIIRYRIGPSGSVEVDPSVAGERLWHSERFRDAQQQKAFERFAELVLESP